MSDQKQVNASVNCPPEGHDTYLPHPTDCTKFYQCVFGDAVELECPPGMHFSVKVKTCDWPVNAGCE